VYKVSFSANACAYVRERLYLKAIQTELQPMDRFVMICLCLCSPVEDRRTYESDKLPMI
jgi:hypothetical protein